MKRRKILNAAAGAIAGVIIGLAFAALAIHLIESGVNASDSTASPDKPLEITKLVLAILLSFISMALCSVLQIILHETGHLMMGLLTGYRFLSFRIFSWVLRDTGKGLRWSKYSLPGTLGQCLMEPGDSGDENIPYFWYNAGGVIMNLALTLIGALALLHIQMGLIPSIFFMMLFLTGLFFAITNGIPICNQGISNDGMNILLLLRIKERRITFRNTMSVAAHLTRGMRPSEIQEDLIFKEELTDSSSTIELSAKTFHMALLEDCGALQEARMIGEAILRHPRSGALFQMEVGGDVLLMEILTSRREDVIKKLWTKKAESYTRATQKSSPLKSVLIYAYEVLVEGRTDTPSPRAWLEKNIDASAFPGEARTALFLLSNAERQAEEIRKNQQASI